MIDYSKHEYEAPGAAKRCPTGAIVWVEGAQSMERSEACAIDTSQMAG